MPTWKKRRVFIQMNSNVLQITDCRGTTRATTKNKSIQVYLIRVVSLMSFARHMST